jgi:3-deoxy-D-arabino-heptulosonate 7-phosphate (DAHP) synthase
MSARRATPRCPACGKAPVRANGRQRMRAAISRACDIIEAADARLLALDGPCGGLPPVMSLDEWRTLYVTLDNARKVSA